MCVCACACVHCTCVCVVGGVILKTICTIIYMYTCIYTSIYMYRRVCDVYTHG